MTTPVVELIGVSLTYPGPPPVPALEALTLSVNAGEMLAITGPSGSGKSTLLNVVGLLDRPTGGRYTLGGVDTTKLGQADRTRCRSQQIGFVFQAFHLLPNRSAIENVALPLTYQRAPVGERRSRAAHALQAVGLQHRAMAAPHQMSGGERQRVAIARALITRPSLLLCDEPTGNLDSGNATEILELLRRLNAQGATVMVITHDERVAASCQRQVSMIDGRVAADVSTSASTGTSA